MKYEIRVSGSGTLDELKKSVFELGSMLELTSDSDDPIPNGKVVWEDETLMTVITEEDDEI
jgi:hypothetical protein